MIEMTIGRTKKPKSGYVYFGKSVRKNGKAMEYVGSTTRTVKVREAEHKREVKKKNSKTWVGKGKSFKVTGKFWSKNPRKAERTIKQKRRSAYKAGKYRSKYSGKKTRTSPSKRRSSRRTYRSKSRSRRSYQSRRR